ncbi:4Fe-4S dicluster domain-containing protein [Robertmurraya andreesenii]|uniref:Fe-S-cluster-containing hydrogenase component 2 n=1 Tax=Anoxybacillus andreesenii TaxID=1325932 RepID=A0ABT9V3A1_9BACL|nr:4Fe-4S dicluster domain-containing protein [Robertmurraya andreesenii]MDQ0155416.1 Fe-S-cluster-containing hydrogenase component 2 [Robertmurraya andreesenii]
MGIFSKWIESLDYEYCILTSCSRHKSPRSTCTSCLDICPTEAITLKNGIPVIHQKKCMECGKCISACPVQAVAGIFPKREFIQQHLVVDKDRIPSVKEMLVYARKGVKGIISEENVGEAWSETIEKTNELLKKLDMAPLSIQYKKIERKEETYTRRELFFSWKEETQSLMKEMAPAKWRFNHKDLDLSKYYQDYQFADIYLDTEKCTLCKACQKLCDKNCIQITNSHVIISAQACSACRLCEDICPEKAISVSETVRQYEERKFDIQMKTCQTCGQSFEALSDSVEECVRCTKKTLLFAQ